MQHLIWVYTVCPGLSVPVLGLLHHLKSFGAKFQTTFVVCFLVVVFFFLTNFHLERKKFICKVERLNVKQRRSSKTAHNEPSHLDLCCLQKPISSPMAVKELQ